MNLSEIVLYTTADGKIKIDTIFQNETIWPTQKKMAELYDVNIPAISKHLSNIYEEGELKRDATVSKMEIVQQERKLVCSILKHTTGYLLDGGKLAQTEKEVLLNGKKQRHRT